MPYIPNTLISQGGGGGGSVELDYVENTSDVVIASTNEGSPTTVVTGSDLTVDGSTIVLVTFSCRGLTTPDTGTSFSILNLHASTNGGGAFSDLGRLVSVQNNSAGGQTGTSVTRYRRLTPAAGTIMYRIVGWASSTSGNPTVQSGAGGAATGTPISLRVETVVVA